MAVWKKLMSVGSLFSREVLVGLTLFMLAGFFRFAAAGELPFTKPVDNIPANVYGGNKKVWDIEAGDDGVMYVAASEWLCIWDGMEWHDEKAFACLRTLYYDRASGRLYGGGDNFFGYWLPDRFGNMQFTTLYCNHDNRSFIIFWRIIPKGNILYVQTHENIYAFDMVEGRLGEPVASGYVGYIFDGGDVVFGQVDGVLTEFSGAGTKDTGIVDQDRIVAVKHEGNGFIYVTEYGGIRRFRDGKSGKMFPHLDELLVDDRIFSAGIRDDGSLLLGTVLSGVYRVDANGNVIEHYSEKNGLDCSTVLCLAEENDGSMWLGLDGGLSRIGADNSVMVYRSRDVNIGDVYSALLTGDKLLLGTNKGLFYVDESREPRLVSGMKGVVWNIVGCGGFLAVEMDSDLYVLYPDGRSEMVLPKVWRFTKWKGMDNLYFCSDHEGIVMLEESGGSLAVRNRMENCKEYSTVPLKHDAMGNLWVDGLWGGVQRLTLDKSRKRIQDDVFYPIGAHDSMAVSHNVDGILVFTQGQDCYTYDLDKDKMVFSGYYTDICHVIGNPVHSFYQKGNFYFVYGAGEVGVAERHGNDVSYVASVSMEYDKYDFSDNFSTFTALNDSLVAIGCSNGLVLYDVNSPVLPAQTEVSLRQVRYTLMGKTFCLPMDEDAVIPYDASNIALQLSSLNRDRTVYYSVDGKDKVLLRRHSCIVLPYLSGGKHRVELYGSMGECLLHVDLIVRRHWLLSWWSIIIAVMALFMSACVIVSVFRHRTAVLKRKYAASQSEMMEKERMAHENEKLQMELKERNAKLTSMAINDMTVNNMLKEIEVELGKVAGTSKEMKDAVRPVKKVVERFFRENGSWDAFQAYFNGLYDGFFDRLKNRYPNLTPNDVKICSYIKLGMSTKEIASLMNIEPVSAESARYRLRKSMGLTPGESLTEVISRI